MKEAFHTFDKNDDGYISKEELSQVMYNLGHVMSNEELDQMIGIVDKDGKIHIDEVIK